MFAYFFLHFSISFCEIFRIHQRPTVQREFLVNSAATSCWMFWEPWVDWPCNLRELISKYHRINQRLARCRKKKPERLDTGGKPWKSDFPSARIAVNFNLLKRLNHLQMFDDHKLKIVIFRTLNFFFPCTLTACAVNMTTIHKGKSRDDASDGVFN